VAKKKVRRKRIGKGIYRDSYGQAATVKVGSGGEALQREKRFSFDTPIKEMREWQDDMRAELRKEHGRPNRRGTLEADAKAYLVQVKHLTSYKSRVCEVNAWVAEYGRLKRAHITEASVRKARAKWAEEGYAPKTINSRIMVLQHLYHTLDGERAKTPCDDIKRMPVPVGVKVLVPATTFRKVAEHLKPEPKTRARFMVIASTGCRPAEVRRAEPGDVDLSRRFWVVRTAKDGKPRGILLNDEMFEAWKAFIAADAWGHFDASDYAKALYAAGWPRDVRPYQARHSVALELGEKGIDLADVASLLGHKDVGMTRKHYQGILSSRLKGASDALAGRFSGWQAPDPEPTVTVEDLEQLDAKGGIH
jgi:site-specific recombinase XerD